MFFGKKKGSVSIHFVCTGPLVKYAASFGKGLTSSGWVHGKFRKFQSPALGKSIYITVALKEMFTPGIWGNALIMSTPRCRSNKEREI